MGIGGFNYGYGKCRRDLFRKQEEYVDQTVTIGGWVRRHP